MPFLLKFLHFQSHKIDQSRMNSYDLLIINGLVVTAADIGHYDIAIKDERIALLAPTGSLIGCEVKRIIDAEGGYVMVPSHQNCPFRVIL